MKFCLVDMNNLANRAFFAQKQGAKTASNYSGLTDDDDDERFIIC